MFNGYLIFITFFGKKVLYYLCFFYLAHMFRQERLFCLIQGMFNLNDSYDI